MCKFGISKRKQLLIIKSLVPLALFMVAIFLIWSRSELLRRKRRTQLHTTNLTELKRLRLKAVRQHRDEFISPVLYEVRFHEIDLLARKRNIREYYDEMIEVDEAKVIPGLGEGGAWAEVPNKYAAQAKKLMGNEKFNVLLSQLISVRRSIPDAREPACRNIEYDLDSLPRMSIITTFKNEPYVNLIRMLHGLFDRTPSRLLLEIILIDDFSSNRDLLGKLERYLATRLPAEKIRLIRLNRHAGLIRARMIGAYLAAAEVLVFLDAHCEVNEDWAQPLLQRVKEDRTVVACPIIDIIDEATLQYKYGKDNVFYSGGFKWTGHFDWIPVSKKEERRKKFHHEPTKTPAMAGGLYAIDKKYFWKMGSYDPGMKIWGGENLEMSFRIWMCGGQIETIPCSRVGHLYRSDRPYKFSANEKTYNLARVAEVWMDDYKHLLLKNQYFKADNIGDVSKRKAFRKRNKCHSFQWYLDNVYPEKFKLERDSLYYGQVKNPVSNHCLDYWGPPYVNYTLVAYNCSMDFYVTQEHFLSKTGQLRKEMYCATPLSDDVIGMIWCEELELRDNSFRWDYDVKTKQLAHPETRKCLAMVPKMGANDPSRQYNLIMQRCTNGAENQKWVFTPGVSKQPKARLV